MRLICGVLHLDGANANEDLLRAMVAQMDVPRLCPALRLWRNGPVGLAVLDFSARSAPTPALPETAGSIIAADVRLDEPIALARLLGGNAPDAEDALLLAMLERSGPSTLDQVLGDFAFASWNKDAQRLVCGRDAFGIRPLAYVYQPGRLFAFASFPKALHGGGIVPKRIDEDAVARRMVYAIRANDCLVAGIRHLPPAHFIEVSREGLSLTRYWQLDRTRGHKALFAGRGRARIAPAGGRGRQVPPVAPRGDRCAFERGAEFLGHRGSGRAAASRRGPRLACLFVPRSAA